MEDQKERAEKRDREHREAETRPGEEENDEAEVMEEDVGKRRRILNLNNVVQMMLEEDCEGISLGDIEEEIKRAKDEQEELRRIMKAMQKSVERTLATIDMLKAKGATAEDVNYVEGLFAGNVREKYDWRRVMKDWHAQTGGRRGAKL